MSAKLTQRYRVLHSAAPIIKSGGAAGVYTFNVARGASGAAIISLILADEVGTGSVQMTVTNKTATGTDMAVAASLAAALTAAGTTHYAFGYGSTTAEAPITEAWFTPLTENFTITLSAAASSGADDGFTTATLSVAFV